MDTDNARNLTCHRAARSVWDKRGWRGVTIEERVSPWIISLAGAGLLIGGARQRSWRGVRWMIGGATLVGCAAAGLCNPRDASVRWRRLTRPPLDRTTTELMDSFPASDPPSSSGMAINAALACDL
jgi:hypothetical protein